MSGISEITLLVVGLVVAGTLPVLAADPPAEHTVSWYAVHPAERQAVLRRCNDDRSLDGNGDCRNATAAAAQTEADGSVNGQDAFAAESTVAPYRVNGALRGMVLGACKTNRPPPVSWCRAAQQAESEIRR